ncbi:MAG TPA: J domain-containing protein [Planctomycetota bacterium]|nr:J domain-containing protein [Planctomycetota bacterium]
MAAKRDLYEILGVSRTADKEEIKKRYKKLARQLHPDVNPGDKEAERRFKEINAAHAVLSDDEKRKLYDEFGDIALQTGFDAKRAREYQEAVRSGGMPQGFGGGGGFEGFDWTEAAGGGGGVNFEDLFSDLFGGRGFGRGARAQRGPAPGDDIEASIDLDFLTAVKGGSTRLSLEKPMTCRACDGTGAADKKRTRCPDCKGTGRAPASRGPLRFETACSRCGGEGTVIAHPCPQCGGQGAVLGRETVEVTIPPGVREGQRLRLAGLGAPGERGASPGDLYVRIHVAAHPNYKREGDDLQVDVPITVPEAIAGATVKFPSPSGEVSLKVPPGTQSGRRFRLRGLGVATRSGKGDLYARVVVVVPERDGQELRDLAQRLAPYYSRDPRSEIKL